MSRNRVLRAACFTLFLHDEDSFPITALQIWTDPMQLRYAIWQIEECPETHRTHVQGYLELPKTKRFTGIKALFRDQSVHLEERRGSRTQARDYCRKDESRVQGPFEHGTWINGPGERTDLHAVREAIFNGANQNTIDDLFPNQGSKDFLFIQRQLQRYHRSTLQPPDISLRTWQQELVRTLGTAPHPRQIMWYWDPVGNTGKTTFSKWLLLSPLFSKKVQVFQGGKRADVAFAYDVWTEVVIFDFTRDSLEYISYDTLECIKNGMFFGPKYQSALKVFEPPHVLVFANQEPDRSKLSQDRWDIHQILTLGPNLVV